jgi:hypothetical protein
MTRVSASQNANQLDDVFWRAEVARVQPQTFQQRGVNDVVVNQY